MKILQLNIIGISKDKGDVVARLAFDNKVDIILLEEIQVETEQDLIKRGIIPDYT